MVRFMSSRIFAAAAVVLTLGLGLRLSVPALAGEPVRFMQMIEDLPLMPGLDEDADAGINFDSPGGRIVEVYAVGPVSPAEVAAYYQDVLPQLGWRVGGGGLYIRDAETLRVEAVDGAAGEPLSVRFRVQPAKP